jgi:electron transport complex protein RnfC
MPPPGSVTIPVSMHIGAPARPTVKAGDRVCVGTLIAEGVGAVSSPVYSSVSGKVKKLEPILSSNGRSCTAIIIESDGQMTPDPSIAPPKAETIEEFVEAVKESGLVGLGGAGFPTAVKLDAEKKGIIKKIVINGAECEPYITSDTVTMTDKADKVQMGVRLLERFISADEIVIGIEANKPECINTISEIFADDDKVKLRLYTDLLYNQALLVEGLPIEDPLTFAEEICKLM